MRWLRCQSSWPKPGGLTLSMTITWRAPTSVSRDEQVNLGRHLAALLQQDSTFAGTVLRITEFLANQTEGVLGEVIPPLRRLILRHAGSTVLTQYAYRELDSARHLEPAGAVSSDALDALMMPALSVEAVPDLIRSFKIVYGSPESRATVGLVYSAVSLRKVITALARSNSPEGAFALVSLSDFVSRSPTAYVPAFELHLLAQALAEMGVHAVDAVSRKLSDATGMQRVFLEAALAANVEPAAQRSLAVHASLAWPDLLRDGQDLHAVVGWTDQRAIHSVEYGTEFYSTRRGGGFQTKWGYLPDTQDGMVIFRLGRLGLAERPRAPDRLAATLESNHYPTQAAAFAVLANVRDKPAVIAALMRYLAKSNSEPVREYLSRLETPAIADEVRY